MADKESPQVIVIPPSAAPAAAPAPVPAAPSEQKAGISMSSKQFEKRLAEERDRGERKLLKELGIDKGSREETLSKIKEGLFGLTDRAKIEADQAKVMEDLRQKASKADALEPVVKAFAASQFDALPEAAKAYVEKKAGADTMARFNLIQELKDTGMLAAIAPAPAAAPPPVNPASTTAAAPTQAAPATGTEKDEYQTWRDLVASGQHIMAANYMSTRQPRIYALMTKYGIVK